MQEPTGLGTNVIPAYRYRARLVRVIDGDTFLADIDLGFRVHAHLKVRIAGVDCPERGKPGWGEARDEARRILSDPLIVESRKDSMSFERWVCDVYVGDRSVADQLVESGHAVPA